MKSFFYTVLLITLLLTSCRKPSLVQNNGVLKVDGNRIVNKVGEDFSVAGNSLFWGNNGWEGEKYYTEAIARYLRDDWNSLVIRAAMGVDVKGGYITDTLSNRTKVEQVVNGAIANDQYVIVDFHSHHAEDYEKEAVIFFSELAEKYHDVPNIIYEIYNEPLNVSWDTVIKPYALKVIEAIRKHDHDNMILVGTPNWCQDVDEVIDNPIKEFSNIAYTLHFYAATHRDEIRSKAIKALESGIPLFVSEWGTIEASGDGNVDYSSVKEWMSFMKKYGLSHLNWSICDKNEGASIFKADIGLKETYTDNDLSESGIFVKEIISNWNEVHLK